MALVYKDIAIDVNPGKAPQTIHVSQYDINRQFNVSLTDDGIPLTLPASTTAVVEGSIGRYSFRENANVSNNVVTFVLSEAMTANKGKVWTKIKLTEQNHPLSTCAFWLDVDRAGVEADAVIGAVGFDQQLKAGVYDWMDENSMGLKYWMIHQSHDSSNPASPSDMPINSYFYSGGSRLGDGWFDALDAGKLYFIYCYANMYNPAVRHYQVFERDSGNVYEGYTSDSGATVSWAQLYPEFDYNPSVTPFSVITDMPSMSVYRGAPDKFTLGDNFGWTLKARVTYRIAKFGNLILVSSPASDETYVGTYSDLGVDSWNKFATDDVYESIQPDAVQIYTDFKFIEGKVFSGDNLIDKPADINLQATEKMPCLENTDYFNRFPNYSYNLTTVVFYDKTGQIIGHITQRNFESYTYTTPDGTQEFSGTYLKMLKFTTPENAAFFAFNWSMTEANKKYFCVSNVPLFLIGFSQPSIILKANSPLLAKKDKTLCVIGPSGVMIDRLYVQAASDYISGFQEHLRPFYKDVISYGYSSATYAVGGNDKPSICEYITQGVGSLPAKNFANIDEVLFIQSGSALSTLRIGDAGGLSAETVDTSTMIGSIRGIVQYILSQNPRCKIYIAGFYKYNNSIANLDKVQAMHDATKELCEALGLTYIDLWNNTPFNYSNYSAENHIYTYDGGHANSLGNKALADAIKPRLLYESGDGTLSGEKSLKMLPIYDYTSCDDVHEACVLFLSTGSSQPTPQITDFPFPERGWLITYDTNGTNTRAQTAIRFTDGYQLHRICTFAGVWSEWTSNEEKGLEYWYIHQSHDSSNPASPSDMPINSYTYTNGARLGSGWFGALKSSKLYFIYCYANMYNPAVRHYQVFEKDSGQVYEGYTVNSGVDVNWSNASGKKSLKVLQIGSSFGQDCCTYAPYIMEDMCDNVDVTFGILYYSGGSIEQYNQWIDNDFAVHYYKKVPGATAWTTLADSTVKNALKDEDWDVILFNQSAADGGNWDKYTDASSYVAKLAAYVGHPVQLGYLMPQKAIGYSYLYSDMVNCAKKVYDLYPVSFVIPAGTAIEIARGTGLDSVGTVGHLCNDSTVGHLQEGLPCLIAGFVTAAKLLEVCGFERSKIYHSSIYPTQAWVDARNIPGFNGTSVGLEGNNKLLGERCAIQALKEPIESSKTLVVQPRNDYSSCDDVDESCVLFNTDFGGTYTFSDFPFNEAGWLITIKSFAAYATRLQIAISFGSLGVKFRKCNISGAWGAWSTGGGGEVLASCDLDTVIGGGIGFYLLISDNSYTHTPEGLGMGFLLKLTAGDWTYQIFFSLTDHKVWSRTYGLGVVDGVVTPMWRNEWTRLGGSGGGGNHYENTYNITCNPTITTDTNNYLASPGDTTDMTGAIQTMLNTTGACILGPGDFYVTGIEIPNNATLRGSGTRTRLILAQSVSEGYAVKLKTYSCIKDLQILGQTAQYTPMSPVGKRDGIVFEGTADAKMNPTVYYRSTIENVILANFHGSAIRCENTGLNVAENLHVTDVFAYWCDVGINIAYLSEFHRWTNVSVTGCYYGCICNGGNNNFANCDFSGNTLGLLIDDSAGTSLNNSHGTFSACSFNHSGSNSGTAIRILGADNGEVFTGCQIFYGAIEIDGSTGIRFVGANIGRAVPIRVTNSKVVGFSDCTMFSASENPITQSGNTTLKFSECYFYNGDTVSL